MPDPSRRRTLATGGLIGAGVLGAGLLGAAGGLLWPARRGSGRDRTPKAPPTPPAVLQRALARELALIARLDTAATEPVLATGARLIRRDHLAHADAVRALLRPYATTSADATPDPSAGGTTPSPSPSTTTTTTTTPTAALLRGAETAAARQAAIDSSAAEGETAALLASIAACEASHARWLT